MKPTATIRDVAREAGVSVASASRALNGHVNVASATRDRILTVAERLDYVPHVGARSLTMARTNTIGVVLPDLFGEFFSEIIRGIDRAAHAAGVQLLLANMHGSAQEAVQALRAMRGRVDGLLVMAPVVDRAFLAANLPNGLPTVVMNGDVEGAGRAAISVDNIAGTRAMVDHLVRSGRRRIAHIAGPQDNSDARERLSGFRDAVADLLGDRDPLILDGDFHEDSGRVAGAAFARGGYRVDAILAANDMMAVGCIAALEEAGVAVPRRVAVTGFDDIPLARYVTPALTTMRVRIDDLGARAFERVFAMIATPEAVSGRNEMIVPELVVRRSG